MNLSISFFIIFEYSIDSLTLDNTNSDLSWISVDFCAISVVPCAPSLAVLATSSIADKTLSSDAVNSSAVALKSVIRLSTKVASFSYSFAIIINLS